jgi:hypothetical protein
MNRFRLACKHYQYRYLQAEKRSANIAVMKVTLESTSKLVMLKTSSLADGILCRIWEGTTETGIRCHAYIPSEIELQEQRPASAEIDWIPPRLGI